jgi:hypothetical protein
MKLKHYLYLYGAYAVGIYVLQRATQKGYVPTNYLTDPIGTVLHYPSGLA